jgi:Trk K+ transport system NAD-binding subunit
MLRAAPKRSRHNTGVIAIVELAVTLRCRLVIVTDNNDSDNIRFILTARKLRPDIKIHTVVNDPSLVETAKDAGANVVIPSSVAVGQLLAFSAGAKDLAGVVFSEKMGTQGITEFMIPESSPLIGKKLQEVAKLAKVAGVLRDGKVDSSIFGGSFTLGIGDILLVIGDTSNLKKFKGEKAN